MLVAGIILGFIALLVLLAVFGLLTSRDRAVLLSSAETFEHDGQKRTYRVSTPPKPVTKIVVGIHGFTDHSRQFAYYTALHNAADDSTLVVYPDAIDPQSDNIKSGWNASFCCGSGWDAKTDDVGFIIALIDFLKDAHNADQAKVFAAGFSNGAFMAQRLAIEHPDVFTAIAGHSGTIGTTDERFSPQQPVPILLLHGEKDTTVPFRGGASSFDPDFVWLSFEETQRAWQEINGETAETKAITYPDDAHVWHGWRTVNIWRRTPTASQEIMTFFNSF